MDFSGLSDWDIATRYHEFKTRPQFNRNRKRIDALRSLSIAAVINEARSSLGQVTHPLQPVFFPLDCPPPGVLHSELDVEETLESSPWAGLVSDQTSSPHPLRLEDIQMLGQLKSPQTLIIAIDTSLSMIGEKLALTAVALCIVLLQFPEDSIGVIAFENEARTLLHPGERISLEKVLGRFLDVPAKGYTHLENGMKAALKLSRSPEAVRSRRPPSTLLLTDGKYTAGKDPAYLASRFSSLSVLKMGDERSSLSLCEEIAKSGCGALHLVDDLKILPRVMTRVVHDLLRGNASLS